MAIIEDSSPVEVPEDSTKVIRYLDLPKILSLIDTRSLFLARMDRLEDKFEGRMLSLNSKYREEVFHSMKEDGLWPYKSFFEFESSIIESHEIFRKRVYINSWNIYEGESVAMWKIYSEMGNGIAIQSDIFNVKAAFSESHPHVYLSKVEYIDPLKDKMKDGNIIYPIITKQSAFNYENEFRVFYISHEKEFSEENTQGFYLPVRLESLISKIIIGPYTPKWIEDVIKNLLIKYEIDKPVERSSILL